MSKQLLSYYLFLIKLERDIYIIGSPLDIHSNLEGVFVKLS
jgi:hypothetical protein